METRRRSALKALSWRVFATMITFFVALIITGETDFAIKIGLMDTTIKFVAYFTHERVWVRIPYGIEKDEGGDEWIDIGGG